MPGPLQLYVALLILEVALMVTHEPQARAPPVAVITGAVLFSVTVTLAEPVPVLLVATTVYVPAAVITGFCAVDV